MSKIDIDGEYEPGQDNIQVSGFDFHNPVFPFSAVVAVLVSALVLLMPGHASEILLALRNQLMSGFDWFFQLLSALSHCLSWVCASRPWGVGWAGRRPNRNSAMSHGFACCSPPVSALA